MSSNINPFNIDGGFPIAGQDNDSQGFRDNFTNTRNNFSFTKSELEDLQSKVVLKAALTGSTLNNNMAASPLIAAQLSGISEAVNTNNGASGALSLDYQTGNIQRINTGGSVSLSFVNWPQTGLYGRMTVWVNLTSAAHTVTIPASVTKGLYTIAYLNVSTKVITFDVAGDYILEFITIDGGTNVLIKDVTRNYASLLDNNLYYNNDVVNTFFINYGNGLTNAMLLDRDQDAVSAFGGYDALSIGNLKLANLTYPLTDTGRLAGYNMTSARGNIAADAAFLANAANAVKSTDPLGVISTVAFTGNTNSVGNSFQVFSSINSFATGANVAYGLGGNIGIFTTQDATNRSVGANRTLLQAVGIENDQTTKFYGNLVLTTGSVPATAASAGTPGTFVTDGTYLYYCLSSGSWKRATMAAW